MVGIMADTEPVPGGLKEGECVGGLQPLPVDNLPRSQTTVTDLKGGSELSEVRSSRDTPEGVRTEDIEAGGLQPLPVDNLPRSQTTVTDLKGGSELSEVRSGRDTPEGVRTEDIEAGGLQPLPVDNLPRSQTTVTDLKGGSELHEVRPGGDNTPQEGSTGKGVNSVDLPEPKDFIQEVSFINNENIEKIAAIEIKKSNTNIELDSSLKQPVEDLTKSFKQLTTNSTSETSCEIVHTTSEEEKIIPTVVEVSTEKTSSTDYAQKADLRMLNTLQILNLARSTTSKSDSKTNTNTIEEQIPTYKAPIKRDLSSWRTSKPDSPVRTEQWRTRNYEVQPSTNSWRSSGTGSRGSVSRPSFVQSERPNARKYEPASHKTSENSFNKYQKPTMTYNKKTENQQFRAPMKNTSTETGHPLHSSLKKLVEGSAEDIVKTLYQPENKFETLIQEKLPQDMFFVVLQLLKKLCDFDGAPQQKSFILCRCCNSEFLDQFGNQIMKCEKLDLKKVNILFENIVTFFENIVNLLPYTALDKAASQILACSMCAEGLKQVNSVAVREELLEKLKSLVAMLDELGATNKSSNLTAESRKERLQQMPPPEDFRSLSVYPSAEEVLSASRPFLRPNLVSGRYNDVEHYLDVQFRLLREDFLRPLREGIATYKTHGRKPSGDSSINVYEDVYFMKTTLQKMEWTYSDEKYWEDLRNGDKVYYSDRRKVPPYYGNAVNLNINKRSEINLSDSKNLMHGSLLCFTKNNFETILFATVANRNTLMSDDCIHVEFCQEVLEDIYESPYLMIECEVYFEPYFHVLNVLRSLHSYSFPMAKYLVEMSSEESPPAYLLQEKPVQYFLEGVKKRHTVTLLEEESWPSPEQLGLDPSQYRAFRAGLTQELSVIQGPPGTGKTFIALKIAQALIENKISKKPILVVCLTNHALDQFLMGILKFTKRLIRVGGQSKVEELENYNLNKLLRFWADCYEYRLQINYLRNDIVYYESFLAEIQKKHPLKIVSCSTLCDYKVLKPFVQTSLKRGGFLEWLQIDGCYLKESEVGIPRYRDQFLKIKCNHLLEKLYNKIDHDDYEYMYDEDYDFYYMYRRNPRTYLFHRYGEDDFDTDHNKSHTVLTFKSLETKIQELSLIIPDENSARALAMHIEFLKERKHTIEFHLRNKTVLEAGEVDAWQRAENLWRLTEPQRWQLYWHWVSQLETAILACVKQCKQHIKILKNRMMNEMRNEESLHYFERSDVIGMTTTGAARLHETLERLNPEIVIVEEAAEVLESHIVASLTDKCKHLILIGDHKQLRPNTAVYQLARQFDFDVSLFERLVRNRGQCVTLGVQHRMSPCIASLVSPAIYEHLENHPSVEDYPPVRGLPNRLFFVSHDHPEMQNTESSSRKNEYEAKFLVGLCEHLIQQGYTSKNVTILTTYVGQMTLIQNVIKKDSRRGEMLREVRVTVVDNYQGEESDIILLSLVRSNDENRVGFLATENRVCVALSRARHGMYIVGNMECLAAASEIWRTVRSTLEEQGAIGPALPLRCQNHVDRNFSAKSSEDFNTLSPLGGCNQPCLSDLPCGHPCDRPCHIESHETIKCMVDVEKQRSDCGHMMKTKCYQNPNNLMCQMPCEIPLSCSHECKSKCHTPDDKEHKDRFKCLIPCPRTPACNHACPKRCGDDCESDCQELVTRVLKCGHKLNTKCTNLKKAVAECIEKCEKILNCGHPCMGKCSDDPCKSCEEPCIKILKCGHLCKQKCNVQCELVNCIETCDRKLACGHECQKKCCGEECKPCLEKVGKVIPGCEHLMMIECSKEATKEMCTEQCKHILPCGHSVMVECNIKEVTSELCKERCERLLPCGHPCEQACTLPCVCNQLADGATGLGVCGHQVQLLCVEKSQGLMSTSDPRRCVEPCGQLLQCGHVCAGSCGACLQARFHVPCAQPCQRTLICGHRCLDAVCHIACPPCNQPCQYKCEHQSCSRKCGDPCSCCMMPCPRQCEDFDCSRRCGEKCDVPACTLQCPLTLDCGHPCSGLCGYPCPALCPVCLELPQPHPKLLVLPSCGHVVEAAVLDARLAATEVGLLTCPRCEVVVTSLPRYGQQIRNAFQDVAQAMRKSFSDARTLKQDKKTLKQTFDKTISDRLLGAPEGSYMAMLHGILRDLVSNLDRMVTNSQLHQTQIQFFVLMNMYKMWNGVDDNGEGGLLRDHSNLLLEALVTAKHSLGQQQVLDFRLEILRLRRIAQLEVLNNLIKKIKSSVEEATNKYATQEICLDLATEVTRFKKVALIKEIHEKVLDNPDFNSQFKEFETLIFNNNKLGRYSLVQDNNAGELCKSILEMLQTNFKKSCFKILQDLVIDAIPDTLKLGKGQWFKCPYGHVTTLADRDEPKCSLCQEDVTIALISKAHHLKTKQSLVE